MVAEQTFNNSSADDEISLYEIFSIIIRKKLLIACFFILAVAAAIGYLFMTTPIYEAGATMMVTPLNQASAVSTLLDGLNSSTSKITTEVELITSKRNVEKALSLLDLSSYHDKEGVPYSQKAMNAEWIIRDSLSVTSVKDTNIVKITVADSSPEFARDLANDLCESYNSILTDYAKDSTKSQLEFVESQIPLNEKKLEDASIALSLFQRENRVMQATQASEIELIKYNYLNSRIVPVELEINKAESILAVIPGVPSYEELIENALVQDIVEDISKDYEELLMFDLVSISSGNTALTSLQSLLTENQKNRYYILSQNLTTYDKNLTEIIREIVSAEGIPSPAYLNAMTTRISRTVEFQILSREAEKADTRLQELPELLRQQAELQTDLEVYQAMAISLLQMQQEASLYDASITDNVTEIDNADLPLEPVSPKKAVILLFSGFLGLALGVGLAIIIEFNNKTICSVDELKKILPPDVPFIGWIPLLKEVKDHRYLGIPVLKRPTSFEAERMRLIASSFVFGKKDKSKKRVVTVCSDDKNEGKTSVMSNVAIALTQNGYKVLLVDGDLRMPSCEEYFGLTHQIRGLCDVVMEDEDINKCIIQPLEGVENLHLLPCGTKPLIPSTVYSDARFNDLIDELKAIYDIIIFDAPPPTYAPALLSIVSHAPVVLIITRAGFSNRYVLSDMIGNLKSAGADISGVCLNALVPENTKGYGYSYGYNYNHSYSYSESDKKAISMVVRRIPFCSSRNSYYRKRYNKEKKLRGKKLQGNSARVIHPYASELDSE